MNETAFRLTFAALPGGPPARIRVRRLLKIALRVCRLRAVQVEELSGSAGMGHDAPHEPCTPRRGTSRGEKEPCAFCGAAIAKKYRLSQRFCSTDCRMRFHGRLSRPVGVTPSEHPRSAGVVSA